MDPDVSLCTWIINTSAFFAASSRYRLHASFTTASGSRIIHSRSQRQSHEGDGGSNPHFEWGFEPPVVSRTTAVLWWCESYMPKMHQNSEILTLDLDSFHRQCCKPHFGYELRRLSQDSTVNVYPSPLIVVILPEWLLLQFSSRIYSWLSDEFVEKPPKIGSFGSPISRAADSQILHVHLQIWLASRRVAKFGRVPLGELRGQRDDRRQ